MSDNADPQLPQNAAVPPVPTVTAPLSTFGSLLNATTYALRNGAYNGLSILELHQLTGELLTAQQFIKNEQGP